MNQQENYEIRFGADVDPAEIRRLYEEAGWWDAEDDDRVDPDWLLKLITNSYCFAAAFADGHLIGMGRAISDGVSDAYIQDVVVTQEWRQHGVGAAIVARILQYLRQHQIGWIGLIAEPGSESFYTKLGFRSMPEYTPMRFLR
jgi:GNAT superfamily N-acetyltransferase